MPEKPPLVLYHSGCPDGFAAAWCAYRKMPKAEFVPVNYGQEPPDTTGRDVFILDFSYKRPAMEKIVQSCRTLVVLDHHQSAQKELEGVDLIPCGAPHCSPFIRFDVTKSGARLAWEYFFPDEDPPWIVLYVEDRDLWKWQLPGSWEINAWFASVPWTFGLLDCLYPMPGRKQAESYVEQGYAILRYQAQQVENQCRNAIEIEMDGHKVLSVNATMLISEIGQKLAAGRPFSATYFIRNDGKKVWSLRSDDSGLDVSEIAKKRSGGGHFHAAGFEE